MSGLYWRWIRVRAGDSSPLDERCWRHRPFERRDHESGDTVPPAADGVVRSSRAFRLLMPVYQGASDFASSSDTSTDGLWTRDLSKDCAVRERSPSSVHSGSLTDATCPQFAELVALLA